MRAAGIPVDGIVGLHKQMVGLGIIRSDFMARSLRELHEHLEAVAVANGNGDSEGGWHGFLAPLAPSAE